MLGKERATGPADRETAPTEVLVIVPLVACLTASLVTAPQPRFDRRPDRGAPQLRFRFPGRLRNRPLGWSGASLVNRTGQTSGAWAGHSAWEIR